jgi:hypothetical protein
MSDYAQRLWRYPALAVAASVVLLLWLMLFRRTAVELTIALYEVMFWATPVIGIVVLAWAAWLKAFGPPYRRIDRAVRWSLLAITAPGWLFVLQVVLSGFAR